MKKEKTPETPEKKEENYKKRIQLKLTIGILALIIIIVLLCLRSCSNEQKGLGYQPWDGSTNNRAEAVQGSIQIPGYSNQVVSKANPKIALGNPDGNDVYFVYHIYEGDDEIYTTDLIEPGYACDWDAYGQLDEGVTTLTFTISTFDEKTMEPCNSASTLVIVQVQK